MNPPRAARGDLAYKDAVFLSPHKFIGGPGTPGVLVVKRRLLTQPRAHACPGGGTVALRQPESSTATSTIPIHREEGGTPAIIESIRAGLVFQLKEAVGADAIREREGAFIQRAIASWSAEPQPRILGNPSARRLSIVSFVVRHGDALPAPQLRRRAAQRPVRHPGARRLLLRRALRPPAARASTCRPSREFEREIVRAARGSSRAGCGSTSTTSSPRRSSSSSSRRSTSWPTTAGSCSAALRVRAGDRAVAAPRSRPRRRPGLGLRRRQLRVGFDALLHAPSITEPAAAVRGYLAEARRIVARAEREQGPQASARPLEPQLETLRWFALPGDVA